MSDLTTVYELGTGEESTYTLPPDKAVVAAFEQNKPWGSNWNTLAYPDPKDHPYYRLTPSGRFHTCGNFTARAVS